MWNYAESKKIQETNNKKEFIICAYCMNLFEKHIKRGENVKILSSSCLLASCTIIQ